MLYSRGGQTTQAGRLRPAGNHTYTQGRSQDFSKGGGAEIMEAKAMKRKNCL